MKASKQKVTETIEAAARAAAQLYAAEFGAVEPSDEWIGTAYEADSANAAWPEGAYGAVYRPAFEAAIAARPARRRNRCVKQNGPGRPPESSRLFLGESMVVAPFRVRESVLSALRAESEARGEKLAIVADRYLSRVLRK
jgi:hypothetical protein